jgi:hypothetical protein
MSLPESTTRKATRRVKTADKAEKPAAPARSLKKTSGVTVLSRAKPSADTEKKAPRKLDLPSSVLDGMELAKQIEQGLAEGKLDVLAPQAFQALMAALCKSYAANVEAGTAFPIAGNRSAITSTDVMVVCAALLKAADLQVFELGMWQSWTGR